MDELRRLSAAHYDPNLNPSFLRTGTERGPRLSEEYEEEEEIKSSQGKGKGRAQFVYTPADRVGSSVNSDSAYVTPSAQSVRATDRSTAHTGGSLSASYSAPDLGPGTRPAANTHPLSYPPVSYPSHYQYQSQPQSRSPLLSTDPTHYQAPVSSSFSSLLPAPNSSSFSTLGVARSLDMLKGVVTSPPLPLPVPSSHSSIGHSSGGRNREVLSSWEKAWGNSDEEKEREREKESYGDTGGAYFSHRIGSFEMAGDGESAGFLVKTGSRSSSPVVAAALGIIRAATGERREAQEEVEEDVLTIEGESDSSGSRAWDVGRNMGQGHLSGGRWSRSGTGSGTGSARGDRVQALLMRREAARMSDSSEEEGDDHEDAARRVRERERGSAGHKRNNATDATVTASVAVGKGKGKKPIYSTPAPVPIPSQQDEEGQDSTASGWRVPVPLYTSDPFLETPNTILTRMRARLMQGEGGITSYAPSPLSPSPDINTSNAQRGKKSPESNSSSSSSRSGGGTGTVTGTGRRIVNRSDDRSENIDTLLDDENYAKDNRSFGPWSVPARDDEEVLKRALGVDSDDGEEEGDCGEESSAASDERYQQARATLLNLMHGKSTTGK